MLEFNTGKSRGGLRQDALFCRNARRIGSTFILFLFFLLDKIPAGDGFIQLGEIHIESLVITVFDLYIFVIFCLLIIVGKSLIIFKSIIVYSIFGLVFAGAVSMFVTNFTINGFVELFQWLEMAVFVSLVATLIQTESELKKSLRIFVYLGTVQAIWTIIHFILFGYPGRRFSGLIEGAALIILLGLIAQNYDSLDRFQVPLLGVAVLLSQELKAFLALSGASIILLFFLVLGSRIDNRKILMTITSSLLLFIPLLAIIYLVWPAIVEPILLQIQELLAIMRGSQSVIVTRKEIYTTGMNMFINNPIFGVGLENWHSVKDSYSTSTLQLIENQKSVQYGPHSLLIKIIAETGMGGFFWFAILVMYPFRIGCQELSNSNRGGLYLPIIGLIMYMVFFTALFSLQPISMYLFFYSLGLMLAYQFRWQDLC